MAQIRLDRFLSNGGCGTRSEVKKLLKSGRIQVNGQVCSKGEEKIDPDRDRVCCDGKTVSLRGLEYYMIHKPAGCLTAARDRRQPVVLDLLPEELREGLFPVGRLDRDTEGLLLLTNDGPLAHNLLSPRRHVDKCYYALCRDPIGPGYEEAFAAGLDIGDDRPTLPASLERDPALERAALVTVHEGRFHQVRRMFEALGNEVVYLKRLSMGPLQLDPELEKGAWRPLTEKEAEELKRAGA